MRKILGIILLIVSINSFGQGSKLIIPRPKPIYSHLGDIIFGNPANYQYRVVYERLRGMMPDSAFHLPRYNGVPVGLRGGSSNNDGALAADTLNGRIYHYWNTTWNRLANYTDLATASRFGVEDAMAGQNRIFTGLNNTYYLALDSLNYFRVDRDGVTRMYMDNTSTLLASPDNSRTLQIFNASTRFTGLSVGPGEKQLRIVPGTGIITYADTSASSATPTLQQVTTAGSSSNVSVELTGEDGSDGHALSLVNAYLPLLIQNNFNPSTTPAVDGIMMIRANNAGNGINNQALRITYVNEDGSGTQFATGYTEHILTDATAGSLDVHYNIGGVENSVSKTFMNIQTGGIVRVNNLADTLATKAYARSVGGGGSGTVTSVSFTDGNGFNGTVTDPTTTPAISLAIDNPSFDGWYDVHSNFAFSDQPLFRLSNFGAGSTIGTLNGATIFDGWMFGLYMETGTTTTGSAYSYGYSSGQIAGIAISNSFRYNVGGLVRVEDLSDGTETYNYSLGFGDDWGNGVSAIVDGVYFEYTHTLNSGNWTCTTESNGTKTQTDSGVPVVADQDVTLEVSVYNGNAFFYINKTLVATNTTNIPTGTARATTIGHAIAKSAGTTNRKAYVEWFAYGKRSN